MVEIDLKSKDRCNCNVDFAARVGLAARALPRRVGVALREGYALGEAWGKGPNLERIHGGTKPAPETNS
ncbi:MAG TPA: hypothetical protein VFH31_08515 [Pyrinomonadaceae bacterium]|nr:hypothetical protein [Pyrinomonadaceae bacterium]